MSYNFKANFNSLKILLVSSIIIIIVTNLMFNAYINRTKKVVPSDSNIFKMNILEDWKKIKGSIADLESLKLFDYEADFTRDGKVISLSYELVGYSEDKVKHYKIQFSSSENIYKIFPSNINQFNDINQYVDAERFFEVLGNINLSDIMPSGEYERCNILAWGKPNLISFAGTNKFEIKDGQILYIKNPIPKAYGHQFDLLGIDKSGTLDADDKRHISYFYDLSY